MSLRDGVYTAVGQGKDDQITVKVTIADQKIDSVVVVEDHETPGVSTRALTDIPEKIVKNQTVNVDAISGATATSEGITVAVKKALKEAGAQADEFSQAEVVAQTTTEPEKLTTDVVIVGAGPAGLAAAVSAGEHGLKSIVFEKNGVAGGTANMGMGPLGIDTDVQRKSFNDISVEEALESHMEYTHYRVDEDLVQTYFNLSADTIDWLQKMGVQFAGAFKYFKESYGTWHIVKSEDGRPIGPGAASTMNRHLAKRAEELGTTFYFETPVASLLTSDEAVVGVKAQTKTGQQYIVKAKAVLVATGGFGSNKQMLHDELNLNLNEDFYTFNVPGIDGDGLNMMWQSGAMKDADGEAAEIIYMLPDNMSYFNADAALRQPNLLINQHGDRFMNEGDMGNTTYAGNALLRQPGHYAYCVMDRALLEQYKVTGPDIVDLVHDADSFNHIEFEKIAKNHYDSVITADNLTELADKLGIAEDKLKQTIDEYNASCDQKYDAQFHKPMKYLKKITGEGGYLVGKYYTAAYSTLGGVRINKYGEVLDNDLKPVKGLYSAGQDANSIYGDSYNFTLPGNSMGFAVNSGRMAVNGMVANLF